MHAAAGPEGGKVTVGDYYRAAKYRKLHLVLLFLFDVFCVVVVTFLPSVL